MEIIIIVSVLTLIFGLVTVYLFNKQRKIVDRLKAGDKITIDGMDGEILEKSSDNSFVVKLEVPGMRISKRD
jgi:Na+-transporting NADH:ubiquinone oxidoreductase subunit NqrF